MCMEACCINIVVPQQTVLVVSMFECLHGFVTISWGTVRESQPTLGLAKGIFSKTTS